MYKRQAVSLSPVVLNNYNKEETKGLLNDVFMIVIALFSIVLIAAQLFAGEIFSLMVSDEFQSASVLLVWMIIGQIFSKMYFFSPGFSIARKTKMLLKVTVLFSFINFVINFFFIKRWGVWGSAVATAITAFGYFIVQLVYSHKYYPVRYNYKTVLLNISVFLLVVLITILNTELSILIKAIILTCLLYTSPSPRD